MGLNWTGLSSGGHDLQYYFMLVHIFKNKNCGEPAQFTQLFLGRKRDETFLTMKTNIIHSVKFQEVSTVLLAVIECV